MSRLRSFNPLATPRPPGVLFASMKGMRLLTLLAVATVAAGVYQFRQRRRPGRGTLSPDRQMEKRVHEAIAHAASSPIHVRCINGVVTLRGTVGVAERDRLLAAALAVPGITQVTNLLEVNEPVGDLGPMQSGIATGI